MDVDVAMAVGADPVAVVTVATDVAVAMAVTLDICRCFGHLRRTRFDI